MSQAIWFCGDPHGDLRRVTKLALERRPAAVVFLGDLELPAPLEETFYPLLRSGITVRGIHGNHDADREDLWRRIADGPLATTFNLDGRVEEITGTGARIGGLGGIFHSKVWFPPDSPLFRSYEELDRSLIPAWWTSRQIAQKAEWTANMRLTHRATIFPDVYDRLARREADVLVTHEAPGGLGMHPHGFEAIGELAELLGARTAFHGHHHETREYPVAPSGCRWVSVGLREIVDLDGRPVE